MSPLKKCPVCGKLYIAENGCANHVAPAGAKSQRMMSMSYPRPKQRKIVQKKDKRATVNKSKNKANEDHSWRKLPSTSTKERKVKASGTIVRRINGKEIETPATAVIAEARKKQERWGGVEKSVTLQSLGNR